jgi:hypothetical protein
MSYSKPTLCLRVRRIIQLGKHDFEGFDCFIIALFPMQRSILQLVTEVRRNVELDDLWIGTVNTTGRKLFDIIHTFSASAMAST